jgi:hypothetical protein
MLSSYEIEAEWLRPGFRLLGRPQLDLMQVNCSILCGQVSRLASSPGDDAIAPKRLLILVKPSRISRISLVLPTT